MFEDPVDRLGDMSSTRITVRQETKRGLPDWKRLPGLDRALSNAIAQLPGKPNADVGRSMTSFASVLPKRSMVNSDAYSKK